MGQGSREKCIMAASKVSSSLLGGSRRSGGYRVARRGYDCFQAHLTLNSPNMVVLLPWHSSLLYYHRMPDLAALLMNQPYFDTLINGMLHEMAFKACCARSIL
jgi:hypothetical protein